MTADEIDTLNRLAIVFLETAELRAKNRLATTMDFWIENAERIIQSNDFILLSNQGTITSEQMHQAALAQYQQFDQHRKTYEATRADQADEAELQRIESTIKKRSAGKE